ncbi:membrane protein insertion efficiency factor YidD [Candidatus Paracaedibacter symbiosus]|uniref:membrane protein insertion efficiency factor YidD n=1 Tax=Candidatus Paracaedibacter symbiosus TaxID=244582 RepID=UPI000509AA44|nr:membrane protein insertion efficiency factor YidD [Candidatus Paracaedibacter symbiosus]
MITKIFIAGIKFYRWTISPYLVPRCRFEPTCSRYAVHALQHHGLKQGSWFIVKRLMKCQPFRRLGGDWGYDPVPDTLSATEPTG